ncbi:hypothetical protein F3Y22_tig00013285pilonHSYRG00271 [Hibiscus syriacus]|uniref:Protein kinase domain-containing protein n=1 Tax=Hibiscus syriacus TaxID=106335 RepID=A0A6A3C405_HIBSY|nr:hypothetical protein F3Y22_tig00013285pilonHSYRG00271 [Hibiscus syriacus]
MSVMWCIRYRRKHLDRSVNKGRFVLELKSFGSVLVNHIRAQCCRIRTSVEIPLEHPNGVTCPNGWKGLGGRAWNPHVAYEVLLHLQKATCYFTTNIGEGAFGPVYKARMETDLTVAVKVLANDSKQGAMEFLTEVLLLGRLHHRNLVNLMCYSADRRRHMLVYAYMSNGSLASHLYCKKDTVAMGLKTMKGGNRLQIPDFMQIQTSWKFLMFNNESHGCLVFDDVAAAVLQEENRRKNKEDRQINLQQEEALTTTRGRSTERGQSSSHKHEQIMEENTSEDFDDFCRKEGIKRQFTVANTPQQNGSINTAYLMNRAPSTAIELKTPMEMWTGKPADYSNLHIFGSIVYVMYNSQEISKLDPKSRKCKFLGYADGVKGYRLWDPTARKVIISRDVIFVKDKLQRKEDEPAHDEQEPERSEAPTTRQSDRVRRLPNCHSDYVIEGNIAYCLLTEDGEPSTYQEAINNSDASLWMMAMQEEIEALHKNNTLDLVPLPQGRKPIGNKWVFKIKRNGDDQVERYRARLVVKGYAQKEGPNKDHIEELKAQMAREFEMKDLGSAKKILGMQIHRDRSNRKIWLSQKNYLKKILSRFNMQDSWELLVGTCESRQRALEFVKRILRYIKGTSNVALCYGGSNLLINLVVATSTTEAEYVAATQASKETIWLKMLLEELGHNQEYVSLAVPPVVHRDIKSSNILLDGSMKARVADFGISRQEKSDLRSSDVKGTFGYIDPEYISTLTFTRKSDVYSFGVLLFEIMSGNNAQKGLIEIVEFIADPRLDGNFDVQQLNHMAGLAYDCENPVSKKRPTMRDIVLALSEIHKPMNSETYHAAAADTTFELDLKGTVGYSLTKR